MHFPGINGMLQFQTFAAERKWRILSVQQFDVTPVASDIKVTQQLKHIKGTGKCLLF